MTQKQDSSSEAFSYSRQGNPDGELLVFIHGWPDDETLWDEMVMALSMNHLCVRIMLPWFSPGDEQPRPLNFEEIIRTLQITLRQILDVTDRRQAILVGHDWGAVISYLYELRHSEFVRALVTLDVGGRMKLTSIHQAIFILSYQSWLIAAWELWRLSPSLGDRMSQAFARFAGAPHPERARSRMNYLYVYMWRGLLLRRKNETLPADYTPQVPTFYCFGERKPCMFHSPDWIKLLWEREDCRILAMSNAGHWVMKDQPQALVESLHSWLKTLPSIEKRRSARPDVDFK